MRWLALLLLIVACSREPQATAVACADPVAGCRLPDGVMLRFSQRPSAMRAFDLEVVAPADAQVRAGFRMRDMEMGMNRYRLLPDAGKWRAHVMLPACVQGRSDWILRLEAGKRVYEVPFAAG